MLTLPPSLSSLGLHPLLLWKQDPMRGEPTQPLLASWNERLGSKAKLKSHCVAFHPNTKPSPSPQHGHMCLSDPLRDSKLISQSCTLTLI
ncbi:hypothetical protein NQZ68_013010 [Dissostichus eleginoides]|nr:hypothetical protein NQZ68_013010 [Dissostichus eleginoides]